ncbi:LysR family transcriptional regulator [Piscinibacter sp. XHJ-5]|uniref:LysR family transcriptional regulator n=1 Tax=Piscinibacter sp. XHJ-5 TaxID=3037797 RepID=UPI00245344B9|nr:LysR family transcriptional regulator [Piscinibacter sp. XHJ-5]
MDLIAAMNTFVRVVEAGNFTKAADSLDLPNATVTRLIQGLEQHLEVRLLQRTTRTLTVTPEGATYYERVVRLLTELADIESSAKQSLTTPSGRIRVEAPATIGTMVLLPAMGDFYRAYPGVEVDLGTSNRKSDLIAEGVDCAIRAGNIVEESLVARRIGEFRFTTCASPQFLATHGAPATPDELKTRTTIGMLSSHTGRAHPFRFSNDSGEVQVPPSNRLLLNDTNAYLAAGLTGLGIIQAPAYAVHAALESGRLVAVLEDWQTPTIPVHVIYPPNRFLSAKVRVFIDWVVDLFERHPHLRRS